MASVPSSSADTPSIVEPSPSNNEMTPENPALKRKASVDANGPNKRGMPSSRPPRVVPQPNQRMWAEVASSNPQPTPNGNLLSRSIPMIDGGEGIIRINQPPPLHFAHSNHRAFDNPLHAQGTIDGIQQADPGSPAVPQQAQHAQQAQQQHRELQQSSPIFPQLQAQQLQQRPLSSSVSPQHQHLQRLLHPSNQMQGNRQSQHQAQGQSQNLTERQRLQPHPLSNCMRPPQSPVRLPGPRYPNGNVPQLLFDRMIALQGALEFPYHSGYLRCACKLAFILGNLSRAGTTAKPRARIELRQQPTPTFGDTALGKIEVVSCKFDCGPPNRKTDKATNARAFQDIIFEEAPDPDGCTFCTWACDYGVSNESFWHPAEATDGYCENCRYQSNTFLEEWNYVVTTEGHNTNRVSLERLDELRKLPNMPVLGAAPRPNTQTKSIIDGKDTSRFQGVMFCNGCPWRQVDIKKAKICEPCKQEKFSIMRHRHVSFALIDAPEVPKTLNNGQPVVVRTARKDRNAKLRRCMICVAQALYVCEACPLRVCAECHTFLRKMCKHYLNNLFYFYGRQHIRNDAFLLRSDGGGV